jgi:hypothetical protein
MIDLIYVITAIAFFAFMVAYVRGCESLGRDVTDENGDHP